MMPDFDLIADVTAELALNAKEATLQQIRDRLPAPAPAQPLTQAQLVAAGLSLEATQEGIHARLGDMLTALETISQAAGERDNRFASLVKYEARVGETLRRFYAISGDEYHLRAPDGTALATAAWEAVRFLKDSLGRVIETRYRAGLAATDPTGGW
ncbi:MAG: hypothetical protein ACREUF_04620 [Solimonas sp.]